MSQEPRIGPGDLPVHEIRSTGVGLDLSEVGGFARLASDLAAEAGLGPWIESWQELPKLIVVLDEPPNTATRVAAAFALAGELIRRDHTVLLLDGDDHLPDLTRWCGRLDQEGWIDVARYGVSVEAASLPLPWAPDRGRLLGVGSYQPTRISADELSSLLEYLGSQADVVIACASAGDRGATWAVQPSLRTVCWSPNIQPADVVAAMVRDAGLLGERPAAVLALVGHSDTGASIDHGIIAGRTEPSRKSSPVFRRLAGLLGLLVVVLIVWWTGLFDGEPKTGPVVDQPPTPELIDHSHEDDQTALETSAEPVPEPVTSLPPTIVVEESPEVMTPLDPFTVEVGEAGWCLHVYSLGDSVMATREIARMATRGVTGRVFPGRDDTNKIWYRVYAGSFPTSGEARLAIDELCGRLETEWAMPVRTDRAVNQ